MFHYRKEVIKFFQETSIYFFIFFAI